jgi:hypothetical protein
MSGREARGGTKTVERVPLVAEERETTEEEYDSMVRMEAVGDRVMEGDTSWR